MCEFAQHYIFERGHTQNSEYFKFQENNYVLKHLKKYFIHYFGRN